MIKVPIKFTDFDGKEVTEQHYFHLSKNELIMWMSENDGEDLEAKLKRVGESNNPALIMSTFQEIIERAYGQRVDGSGSEFYKDPDLTKRFLGSLAFDQLFTDLMTNAVSAAAFVNGIMPSGLDKLAAEAQRNTTDVSLPAGTDEPDVLKLREESGLQNPLTDAGEPVPWLLREPNQRELTSMSHAQLVDTMQRKSRGWKEPAFGPRLSPA